VKAALFYEPGTDLRIEDVPTPEPVPGEVRIKVKACGICASDLHIFAGEVHGFTMPHPLIPGHEASGVIEALGPGVRDWAVGDRVVATVPGKTCGTCPPCRQSNLAGCLSPRIVGVDYHGAFAEYLTFPAHSLVRLPESIPFEQGAILADAVGTPFHAVVVRGALQAGERVALFGVGGLGTHAVQIARLAGAGQLIAVDVLPAALARARELGADHTIDARTEDPPTRIKELTDGQGVDLAVELVGRNATITQAVASLARGGRAVLVGVGPEPIQVMPSALFNVFAYSLLGSLGYRREDVTRLVRLVAAGRLDLSGSISARLPLAAINDGVRRLREKIDNPVRIMVCPELG
jgi:2-desacetyl-2-hydroxyethyl bacteriochlorophyllide A dehydrogenase